MEDFIIIGGGIAGISAAARLSGHGSCRVLEREAHLAYHSSGRSAALYEENYGSPSTIALAKAGRARLGGCAGGRAQPTRLYAVIACAVKKRNLKLTGSIWA